MIDNQYNNEKLDGYEVEICGVYKDGILLSTYGYSYTSSENNFENLEYYDFNGKLINSIDISELTESRQIENIAACDNGVRLTLKDTVSDANNPELKSFEVSIDLSSGVIGDLEESSNTPGDYGLDSDFHYDGTWTIGDYSVSHYSTWNMRSAFVISNNGKIKTVDMSVDPEFKGVEVENYIIVSEKEILLVCFSNKVRFLSLDLETGKFENKDEEYTWLNTVNFASRISSFGGKTYITDQSGIKCINFETKELEDVVSFNDCNINRSIISRFDLVSVEDDRYVLAGTVNNYDSLTLFSQKSDEIPEVIVLEKADKNPNAGKIVLTAATVGWVNTSYSISEAIREFNETNKKYYIQIESELNSADYFDYSNAESHDDSDDVHYNGTSAISAQLATDLLSGDAPDIILNAGDYSLIHSEDYLVDLTGYINGKKGIKEADYFTNVIDASKTGDKLFYMPVSFSVNGILADKADVRDGMTGFTFDEYAEFLYGPCNGKDPMNETQLGALCTLYSYMSDTCIDGKEVNFDNESFRALCDYVKENVNDKSYDPNESNGNGSCYNFAEFLLTNGNNVSEKTVLGYPSPDGRGPVISVVTSIGISAEASSAVADGAWEFIKYCLSGEVQEMIARYDENPMSIDAFDTTAKKVLENYNSNNINPFTYTKIEPQDEAVIAAYKNILLSASVTDIIDPAILIVLREELPPYFIDQKSFDDVLKIIQDRVSTIIAERK
jgi:ABC-type glycerol-3-phosphate transport system substrate-binding protein